MWVFSALLEGFEHGVAVFLFVVDVAVHFAVGFVELMAVPSFLVFLFVLEATVLFCVFADG